MSFDLAVSGEEEGDMCIVYVSTEGLSPLRLGFNESLIIDTGIAGHITISRYKVNINMTSTTTTNNQTSGSSVYIPDELNEREGDVHSNKMPGVDLSPVEIAGAIALLALTALAAVKEYGPGRKGGRGT
ncbi:MAG: hypothetical protein GXO68_03200 [Crenarchaeota archaeon]|nr:hypothetical protein [Thermoproteota archaeon]